MYALQLSRRSFSHIPQNNLVYESNYKSGLRIVNVSSIADDPTGAGFFEAAFFDGAACLYLCPFFC